MKVLVVGGAGYIGSHIVRLLSEQGHAAVVLDDLRQGHREAIPNTIVVESEISAWGPLEEAWKGHGFDSVIHLAADCQVGESMARPEVYYQNNLVSSLALLENLRKLDVNRMVFSSTAATYGEPRSMPLEEDHPTVPSNTYGETKLAFERALHWHGRAHGFRSISLRYFNAAGAHPGGRMGEDHTPESHLIPRLLAVALGQEEQIEVYGDDYPTRDGSCVRDYIHVDDLAAAHLLALEALDGGEPGGIYNLGSESGHSVMEVVDTARAVTGQPIPVRTGPDATMSKTMSCR